MQTSSIKKPATIAWVTGLAFLCLFLLGLVDNLKGTTLPAMLAELHFNDAQGGMILFWAYIGFLSASLLVGVLSDLAGNRAVVIFAGACLLTGVIGYSTAHQLGLLAASMTCLGLGLGAVDMSGNLIIVAYYTENKGRILNFMAFFHGLSSTIAPYYAGLLLAAAISWRQVYQFPLVAIGLLLAIAIFAPFPAPKVVQKNSLNFRAIGRLLLAPGMGWHFLMMTAYCAGELGVGTWLVIFLQRYHALSITGSALFLSLYFAGLMVGRLVGTLFVEKVGYLRSILITAALSVLSLGIGTFGPGLSYWVLPLTGLFYAIIFPTIVASATDGVTENVGTLLGLLFATCGLGGAVGPWLTGAISNLAGIQAGFSVNLAASIITTLGAVLLLRSRKK